MIVLENVTPERVGLITRKQKKVLDQLKATPDRKIAAEVLGMSRSAIGMNLTRVYQNFDVLLFALIDNYPTFKRRLEHDPSVYSDLRKLARLIRKEG